MIQIKPSQTADSRTCDFSKVTRETLLASSLQHVGDIHKALAFFAGQIVETAGRHDFDKLSDVDGFMANFRTGFKERDWLDRHYEQNRHHLNDRVPEDVNLIDVLDYIADNVMAGMGRSGTVRPMSLSPELLERAFQNTVELLKREVTVEQPETVSA